MEQGTTAAEGSDSTTASGTPVHNGTQADMHIGTASAAHFACTYSAVHAHEISSFLDASGHVAREDPQRLRKVAQRSGVALARRAADLPGDVMVVAEGDWLIADDVDLHWTVALAETGMTRMMSGMASAPGSDDWKVKEAP